MQNINVIPQPLFLRENDGTFCHCGELTIGGDSLFLPEMQIVCTQLQPVLSVIVSENPPVISCRLDPKISGEESYEMCISQETIELSSSARSGMYHALQTLRQLILVGMEGSDLQIPCAEIHDSPRFSWRGYMLDTSRHFYSVDFVKKLIDLASFHHMNVFHWHLTDDQGWRMPVSQYPGLTEIGGWRDEPRSSWGSTVGGFYSAEDIKSIVEYAAERYVQVVPEIDLPGHASAILAAYPSLGCTGGPYKVESRFGVFEDVLCAGNDQIFDLFTAICDSLVELFPSSYVHIGGDEVKHSRWEACPKCQKRMKELELEKVSDLQSWITIRLVQMLGERGRTVIGWDEVLEGSPKFALPQEVVVMSWRGQEGGIEASAKGHRVIMTPLTDGCYLNFKPLDNPEEPGHLEVSTLKQSYQMEPVAPQMSAEQASLVMGGQCNLWSEVIYASRIAEYMLFPRLCAIAESLWSAKDVRSLESFSARLAGHRKKLDALDVCQYRGPLE